MMREAGYYWVKPYYNRGRWEIAYSTRDGWMITGEDCEMLRPDSHFESIDERRIVREGEQ